MPKILVVDDEAEVRNVVATILKQAGYDVVEAEHGLIGYSKAQSENPDLVLLDLMMPVVDGFEVLRRLKENPSTWSIPVIILTAKIDAASERECMQLGAADYIKKPWGPSELQDRIGMALGYPDLGEPPQTGDEEPRTDGKPDSSEGSSEGSGKDQPPESLAPEPPADAYTEYPENPALTRARRFHIRRFNAERYLEDGPPLWSRACANPRLIERANLRTKTRASLRRMKQKTLRAKVRSSMGRGFVLAGSGSATTG